MSSLHASLPEGSRSAVAANGTVHQGTDQGAGVVEGDFGRNGRNVRYPVMSHR